MVFLLIQSKIFACKNTSTHVNSPKTKEWIVRAWILSHRIVDYFPECSLYWKTHSDDYDIQIVKHFYANNDKYTADINRFIVVAVGGDVDIGGVVEWVKW